jgi:hypothetical protein
MACILTVFAPWAQAENVPEPIQGIWATPNCNTAADTLVFFNGFYLWLGEDETTLTGLALADAQPEGFIRLEETDGYPNFFQVLPDGRLREAFLPDDAEWSAVPNEDWPSTDYESCARLPRDKVMLHGEALALLSVANEAQAVCRSDQAACATTLFSGIDVTGDGNLSGAELARLLRVGGYLAAVSEDNGASNDDLAAVLAASLPVAPLVAAALVNSFDYDDSGTLSLVEISQDRATAMGGLEPDASAALGSRVDRMKEALKPLGKLLENFGQ